MNDASPPKTCDWRVKSVEKQIKGLIIAFAGR